MKEGLPDPLVFTQSDGEDFFNDGFRTGQRVERSRCVKIMLVACGSWLVIAWLFLWKLHSACTGYR